MQKPLKSRGVNKEESDLEGCKGDIDLRRALHRRAASITFWRTMQGFFFSLFSFSDNNQGKEHCAENKKLSAGGAIFTL